MQGVRVTLLGTQQTVTRNPQGRYTLTGIAAGQWRIRASAIGYTPVIIDSIPVRAGQTRHARTSRCGIRPSSSRRSSSRGTARWPSVT